MTDDEWSDLEQAWVDNVRIGGAAEVATRQMREAKTELQRAIVALERARKRAERAHTRLVAACDEAEWWVRLAAVVTASSGLLTVLPANSQEVH